MKRQHHTGLSAPGELSRGNHLVDSRGKGPTTEFPMENSALRDRLAERGVTNIGIPIRPAIDVGEQPPDGVDRRSDYHRLSGHDRGVAVDVHYDSSRSTGQIDAIHCLDRIRLPSATGSGKEKRWWGAR